VLVLEALVPRGGGVWEGGADHGVVGGQSQAWLDWATLPGAARFERPAEVALKVHIHADHITGALHLKQRVNSRIAAPAMDCLPCIDLGIVEGTRTARE
jgi:hypothetical protein